jgi:hypothetical protein
MEKLKFRYAEKVINSNDGQTIFLAVFICASLKVEDNELVCESLTVVTKETTALSEVILHPHSRNNWLALFLEILTLFCRKL